MAFLDSLSTHSFIVDEAAQRAGLPLYQQTSLWVTVANGGVISSTGVCYELPLRIGDEEFKIACYSILLAGSDLVLGVQWL